MDLILHAPQGNNRLLGYYERAFARAVELRIVAAYLTDWESSLKLGRRCRELRIVVGGDFGITRIAACKKLLRWLGRNHRDSFRAATGAVGFHPKAVFWKESDGRTYALVGSSNLTRAAFNSNYEANSYGEVSNDEYQRCISWVDGIKTEKVEHWLRNYQEAERVPRHRWGRTNRGIEAKKDRLGLPLPIGASAQITARRTQLAAYAKHRAALMRNFRQCAEGAMSSTAFYNDLPRHWSREAGDRMQGKGWNIQGKGSNFRTLARSFVKVLDASPAERDYVVETEMNRLHNKHVTTRKAFLTEMLCLRFPSEYPVLNGPVRDYLRDVGYRARRLTSEGQRYIDIAQRLRLALRENPTHPAKNLAELDTIIWLAYHKPPKGNES